MISGAGTVVMDGGFQNFTGNNTYTGNTNVNFGELKIDGQQSGTVNIGFDGTLSGTGTVGDVNAIGFLSPSGGTLIAAIRNFDRSIQR